MCAIISLSRFVPFAFLESIQTDMGKHRMHCCVNLPGKKPEVLSATQNEPLGSELRRYKFLDPFTWMHLVNV